MRSSVRIAPSHSVILIMDRSGGLVPSGMRGKLVASTSSCIAVGTLSQPDGHTHVTIADELPEVLAPLLVFEGLLETPTKTVVVCSVLDEVFLEMGVVAERSKVRIWANDGSEPNEIQIVVSAPVH